MSKIILYNDGELTQSILDHRGLRLDVPAGEKVIILDHSKDITSQAYLKSFYNHYNEFLEVTCDMDDYPLSDTTLSKTSVKFSSDTDFILSAPNKKWDGIIEYTLNDGETWFEWDGSELSGNASKAIYLRGINNTVITGSALNTVVLNWVFTGKYCTGDINNLLSYQDIKSNQSPTMGKYCFYKMFKDCTTFKVLPKLSATTLADYCYANMFEGCTGLTTIPENLLPATTLSEHCYYYMFYTCTNLKATPKLPATTLASTCYGAMFRKCTSLKAMPTLSAMNLAPACYDYMFQGCTSLETLSPLPATTLANTCYAFMFDGCTSLKTLPVLPALNLPVICYGGMFSGCTSLKLSTTKTGNYTIPYRIPSSGTGRLTDPDQSGLNFMFENIGSTFIDTPVVNTTYYLYKY